MLGCRLVLAASAATAASAAMASAIGSSPFALASTVAATAVVPAAFAVPADSAVDSLADDDASVIAVAVSVDALGETATAVGSVAGSTTPPPSAST